MFEIGFHELAYRGRTKGSDWENTLLIAFSVIIASLIVVIAIAGVFFVRGFANHVGITQPQLPTGPQGGNSSTTAQTAQSFLAPGSASSTVPTSSTTSSSTTTVVSSSSSHHHH